MRKLGSHVVTYAAYLKRSVVAHQDPWATSAPVSRLQLRNVNGFREVLGVLGVHFGVRCASNWYHVALPVLPNGTTGWVPTKSVQVYRLRSRIVVDVSERQLRLYRSGKLRLVARVAVGAPATPTPLGRYFVNERYVLPDASGPFGPNALGISAHSTVLQRVWVQDGPIGIHGTNEPWSLGRAASHGCIRVANVIMRRLFALAPAGTPVTVKA
jgi:lipoprotein-anchoring transpeptidase ErfK/SrfK